MVFKSNSVFGWKEGSHIRADAQKAGELCDKLRETKGLTPQTLLDASRKEGTVLHDEFEWDDTVAGEKYRLDQSAHIIRSIIIVQKTEEEEEPDEEYVPVRAFFPVSETKGNYESIHVIAKNDDMQRRLLDNCLSELKAFQRKYAALKDVVQSIEEPIRMIQQKLEEGKPKSKEASA